MKNKIFAAILIVLGLLVATTPRYIVPVCEFTGRAKMACSYMGLTEILFGLLLLAIAIGLFITKKGPIRGLMFVALAAGVLVIVSPEVIGYCPSHKMPCNYGTVPVMRLLGMAVVVTSIVGLIKGGEGGAAVKMS